MARPKQHGETRDVRREISFTPSEMEKLKDGLAATKTPVATFVRAAAMAKIAENESEETFDAIHILGYIHAGDAMAICPMPAQTRAYPPFAVSPECYSLHIIGNSMEAEYGMSIPAARMRFSAPT